MNTKSKGRPWLRCIAVVATLCLCSCADKGSSKPAPAPAGKPPPEWSQPVNGIRGRLIVTLEKLHPGLRHAITLELENVTIGPISISNQPAFSARLFDSQGKPVLEQPSEMSGPIPNPTVAVIPRESYLGFRVDGRTVGVPAKDAALLAVGIDAEGGCWVLKPGKYVLKAALSARKDAAEGRWSGQLELPAVEIVVTEDDVKP